MSQEWKQSLRRNKLNPHKLTIKEIDVLYRIIRPYLVDGGYIDLIRSIILSNKQDFYRVVNTLCKVTNQDYDNQDYYTLIDVVFRGMKMNNLSLYVSLMRRVKNGSSK